MIKINHLNIIIYNIKMKINYLGVEKAKANDDIFKDNVMDKSLYILGYQIVSSEERYFLEFLMLKNPLMKTINLPSITLLDGFFIDDSRLDVECIKNYSMITMLDKIGLSVQSEYLDQIEINGFFSYEGKLFLLIDFSKLFINYKDIYKTNDLIWNVTVDELINKRYIYNYKINDNALSFFKNNPEFLSITDEMNNPIEIPIVAYTITPSKQTSFTFHFGKTRERDDALFGDYYYYYTFNNLINNLKDNLKTGELSLSNRFSENTHYGVIRFLLFLKEYKLFDGTSEMLGWSDYFDSLHVGNVELEYNKIKAPIFIIKSKEQEFPLSYHYLHSSYKNSPDKNIKINI